MSFTPPTARTIQTALDTAFNGENRFHWRVNKLANNIPEIHIQCVSTHYVNKAAHAIAMETLSQEGVANLLEATAHQVLSRMVDELLETAALMKNMINVKERK